MLTILFGGLLFKQNPIFKVMRELNCTAVFDLRDIPAFLCTSMHPFLTAATKAEIVVTAPVCAICVEFLFCHQLLA